MKQKLKKGKPLSASPVPDATMPPSSSLLAVTEAAALSLATVHALTHHFQNSQEMKVGMHFSGGAERAIVQ